MNFANMPELTTKYGYFIVIAAIAVVCTILYYASSAQDGFDRAGCGAQPTMVASPSAA